jgi:flagella basal body P-ring formation protein FlgA
MAQTIVKGAVECGIRRPRVLPSVPVEHVADEPPVAEPRTPRPVTLRDAVVECVEDGLERYGGRVRVDFGRTAAQALDLAGPEYEFSVRKRSGRLLGMIDVEVHVRRDGQVVQRLELLASVAFSRDVVVARRSINQKAEIRPEDVQITEITFDRLDRLGLTDPARVVGQRAKRFIPAGTMLDPRDLERVPQVKRGQLVEVYSTVGATTVRTVAKAMEAGSVGDLIELRGTERRGRMLMGKVTGPRRVELRQEGMTPDDKYEQRFADAGGGR